MNPVPFNGQSYQKQNGSGTSAQLLSMSRNKFRKILLFITYYLTKFDNVMYSSCWVIPKITSANLCKSIHDFITGFQLRIKKWFTKNICSDLLKSVSLAGPTMVGAKGLENFWIFKGSRLLENMLYQRILEKLRFR